MLNVERTIERFKRSFWGGVRGDVYGSVFEFKRAEQIPDYKSIEEIKANHKTNVFGHEFGHFTDDTIFMVLAMEAFLSFKGFDQGTQVHFMGEYIDKGKYSRDGMCFDVGIATRSAYHAWKLGIPCIPDPKVGGNGVLMKMAPYAFWSLHRVHPDRKKEYYSDVVGMTHGEIAIESAYKFGMILESLYSGEAPEFDIRLNPLHRFNVDPSGFCVGSYNLAMEHYHTDKPFNEALMDIIKEGNDTDTNACILGQLIGADDFDYKYRKEVNTILERFCEFTTGLRY